MLEQIEVTYENIGRIANSLFKDRTGSNLEDIELKRAKELLEAYRSIPTGGFGAAMIQQTIVHAERSMQTGNTVEMLKSVSEIA